MNRAPAIAAILAAALTALPAAAILIRADREDAEYLELASRYPATVALEAAAGSGALIAPRWILTSAGVALALRAIMPAARIRIGGRTHEIQQVIVHPQARPGSESDLALVFLREPVTSVEPSSIYRNVDEEGQAARIVGFGEIGRIGEKTMAGKGDGRPRAAINTVDRVTPLDLGLRLKGPDEASDLQGALAPGDGGAPAYFEADGRILVAGIASRTEDSNGDGIAGSAGDWEIYARVSAFAAWIDDAMSKTAVEEAARATAKTPR